MIPPRKIVTLLVLAALEACAAGSSRPGSGEAARDSAGVTLPADSLAEPMIRLLRNQLVAPEPASVQEAVLCESLRLERIAGETEANRLTRLAYAEAHRGVPDSVLDRVDAALATHTFALGQGCDSLAKARVPRSP